MRGLAMLVAVFLAAPVGAQVTATQPSEEQVRAAQGLAPEPKEMCPLQLDLDVAGTPRKRSAMDLPDGSSWVTTATRDFACDKAQVQAVRLRRGKEKRGETELFAAIQLATGWFRQDVNMTVQLLVNGEVKRTQQWRDLTIGSENAASTLGVWGSSSSKTPTAEWKVPSEELRSWFAEGARPSLRIVLEVPE